MEGVLATVMGFGGNFAPRNWAFCAGQLLPINQNQSLFSLIGTIYGGDGRTTFALPDLRGRAMIGPGDGPGLTPRREGQKSGAESVTLNTTQIPSHSHTATLHAENAIGNSNFPENNMLARSAPQGSKAYAAPNANDNEAMGNGSVTINNTGGNLSHQNMMPWLAINYVICTSGLFPSRS